MRLVNVTPPCWLRSQKPGITRIAPGTLRAMKAALRAVDLDIEQTGTVSAESVDKVRHARAMLEGRA